MATYMIRMNQLKAFEMMLVAEESAIMTTTIFNKMADSIILVSEKEHNDNSVID
jgi:hypothetical protein